MSIFDNNIACIEKGAPEMAEKLRAQGVHPDGYRVFPAKSGDLSMAYQDAEGHERLLHSRYDPKGEAKHIVEESVDPDADLVIVGGFALAWHIEAILARAENALVTVIEDDPAALASAFAARDCTALFASGRLDFALGDSSEDLLLLLEGKSTRKVSLFLHRASYDRNPGFYGNLKNILYSFLNGKEVNHATLARFERLWTRNLLRNLPRFLAHGGVRELFGTHRDKPAFVIAAGPSLAKNIDLLREAQTKGIIIAVDTIYKVLLAHGITPDIVVAVDPQLVNAHFIAGTHGEKTILVADSAIAPTLLANHTGAILLSAIPFPHAQWFEEYSERKGGLASGGSVATSAFDLAVQMGANPVVLVGQDLAYSEARIHMRGTPGEERWENSADRLTPVTRNMSAFLRKNRTVRVPNWADDGEVWSDRKFLTFLWWFEKRIRQLDKLVTVINATEGGARIHGAEHKTLAETLAELPPCETKLPCCAEKNLPLGDTFEKAIMEYAAFLGKLEDAAAEAIRLCSRVLRSPREASSVQPRLEKIDALAYNEPRFSRLVSATLQRVIHTVNEGFSLTEDAPAETAKLKPDEKIRAAYTQSKALYEGIHTAVCESKRHLQKFIVPRCACGLKTREGEANR
ncbi:MAG: DUF115 domain-containing protein [Spirochaetota bacterium]|jgi:hypothetical protein|nr:DUF115 domain-containing protein [Spirochaetota bacterium]